MKTVRLALVLFALFFSSIYSQAGDNNINALYAKSIQAYQKGDFSAFLALTQDALKLDSTSYVLNYNLACGYSLTGNKEGAIKILNSLADKGLGDAVVRDADFNGIRDSEEFIALLDKIEKSKVPINNSETAFIIKEKDLIPEGMAYDPVEDAFYIGSIYKSKILKIDSKGNVSEFAGEGKDGLVSVLGMKVDVKRRELIAASSTANPNDRIPPKKIGTASLYRFDLKTGNLIARYELDKDGKHFINDVEVLSNGDIYISDSWQSVLYVISHKDNELKEFVKLNAPGANGIAATPDEKRLFIGVNGEIEVVDIAEKTVTKVKHPADIYTGDCDGLYLYGNSLVGIQNVALIRVSQFFLNDDLTEITGMKVLEAYNPDFMLPTTGAIANGYFYYIANSQLNLIDREGKVGTDQLQDVKILKTRLK